MSIHSPMLDTQHGAPFDRGGADSYYQRGFDPHYWPSGTHKGYRVEMHEMTAEEITAVAFLLFFASFHISTTRPK